MQSYGAVDTRIDEPSGNPTQQATPYPGIEQVVSPSTAAQCNYPPYPPASGQHGEVGATDGNHLPPNVKKDNLPVSDDGKGSSLPSAPPMSAIYGYEKFDNTPLIPPSYDEATRRQEPPNRPAIDQGSTISEDDAREALLDHCERHCCYWKCAARDMVIEDMASTSAYRYVLESFGESRSTAWTSTSYQCGPVDSPMNGPAPLPWDVPVTTGEKFKNCKTMIEVPHTAEIRTCHKCQGMGRIDCKHCYGSGSIACTCHGGYTTINNESRRCDYCRGSGRRRCHYCDGRGDICCPTCLGSRQLKWYIELTVTWTNHLDDYIVERTAMPDSCIRNVQGRTVFEEELPWVFPITQCPEPTVNEASSDLVEKHRKKFSTERILLQRHKVVVVPVTEVHARWKSAQFTFYVHGLEKHVYSADYPQQCCCCIYNNCRCRMCCGCTII